MKNIKVHKCGCGCDEVYFKDAETNDAIFTFPKSYIEMPELKRSEELIGKLVFKQK